MNLQKIQITTRRNPQMIRSKKEKLFYFLSITLITIVGLGCNSKSVNAQEKNDTTRSESALQTFPVRVIKAQKRLFLRTVDAQGSIDTKEHAIVSARIGGVLTDLFVDEGDVVVANQTPLFQVDKANVEQAVEISKQDLAVAKSAILEADANLANMQAQFDKAKVDYERFQRLLEKKAVSKDAYELQETRYKAAKAGLDHALAVCQLSKEQLKKAEHALKIAEKNLSDSLVYAPISGSVSYKFVEQNEYVSGGKPIVKIDNPDVMEMSVFLPSDYYPYIKVNETKLRISTLTSEIGTVTVTYKSPTILPNLRTFEVKAIIDKENEYAVAGAMVQVSAILEERENIGILKQCVMTQIDKKYLFKVVDNKAVMAVVNTGFETEGWIEITEGDLKEGDEVISMGQTFIKEGQPVQILEEN